MRFPRRAGLTLVEIVLIAVAAVALIGLLVPAVSKARTNARTTLCLSNLRQLGMATMTRKAQYNGSYKFNLQDLSVDATGASWIYGTTAATKPVAGDEKTSFWLASLVNDGSNGSTSTSGNFKKIALCPEATLSAGGSSASSVNDVDGDYNKAWGPSPVSGSASLFPYMSNWTSSYGINGYVSPIASPFSGMEGYSANILGAFGGLVLSGNPNLSCAGEIVVKGDATLSGNISCGVVAYGGTFSKAGASGSYTAKYISNTKGVYVPDVSAIYANLATTAVDTSSTTLDFTTGTSVYRWTGSSNVPALTVKGSGTLLINASSASLTGSITTTSGGVPNLNIVANGDLTPKVSFTNIGGIYVAGNVPDIGGNLKVTGVFVVSGTFTAGKGNPSVTLIMGTLPSFDPRIANADTNGVVAPIYLDSTWSVGSPKSTDNVTTLYSPSLVSKPGTITPEMSRFALNRHNRMTNVALTDGSAQTIKLPELWALKWNTSYQRPTNLPTLPNK